MRALALLAFLLLGTCAVVVAQAPTDRERYGCDNPDPKAFKLPSACNKGR